MSDKITTLTAIQETAMLAMYNDAFASASQPGDPIAGENAIKTLRELGGAPRSKTALWFDSPATACIGIAIFQSSSSLQSSLRSSLWSSLQSSLRSSLESSLRSSLGSSLESSLWSSLESSLWSSLGSSLRSLLGCGESDASWTTLYNFCHTLGLPTPYKRHDLKKLQAWANYSKNAGWWWPYENVDIIARRPIQLSWERPEPGSRLHRDGGPSAEWADGWRLWHLHGVRVKQWLAETRAEELDPTQITKIDNAEVRREFVRKVGIDRIVYKLGAKTIEERGNYQLLRMEIAGRPWTYLKMLNPSIGAWHIEGVPNEIATVSEALNFRNGLTPDMIDDENGADWFQQGDVILKPRGAKNFKRQPIVLT